MATIRPTTRIKVFEGDSPALTIRASQSREGKGKEAFPFEDQTAIRFILKPTSTHSDTSTNAVTYTSTSTSPSITLTTSTSSTQTGTIVVQLSSADQATLTSSFPTTARAKLRVQSAAGNVTLRTWAFEIQDA